MPFVIGYDVSSISRAFVHSSPIMMSCVARQPVSAARQPTESTSAHRDIRLSDAHKVEGKQCLRYVCLIKAGEAASYLELDIGYTLFGSKDWPTNNRREDMRRKVVPRKAAFDKLCGQAPSLIQAL
eukprot:1010264-Pleurochrysis_carterae.AAC.2